MDLWTLFLLLASFGCFTAGFQPLDFHYWYLQSSIVVNRWLYIVGGDIIGDDAVITFMPYTYSIDISESWTTSDVDPIAISIPDLVKDVKGPMIWYNPIENRVHMWAGLPFDGSGRPGSYAFTPTASGGVIWSDTTLPSSNSGTLGGLWGSAYATSQTMFYSMGGQNTLDGIRALVKSSVTNDFKATTWMNETSIDGFDSRFTFGSKLEYVPNFGDEGVLIALGGMLFQNQSAYSEGVSTLAGLSSVDVFDIKNKKWYRQRTHGEIPPEMWDFCTVGLQSDDGASYEIYIFGGATNDTYDTTNWNDVAYRDIYVLSLPAFSWIRAGKPSEIRRRALSCQVIGNRQMLLIGGNLFANDGKTRVDPWPNGMAVFDLSAMEWTDGKFDHSAELYRRASVVQDLYQRSTPVWDDPALATIFPFRQALTVSVTASATAGNATTTQPTAVPSPILEEKDSKTDHTGAIVGGVIGGVAAIALIAGCACVLRRRKKQVHNTLPPKLSDKHPEQEFSETTPRQEMCGNHTAPVEMYEEAKPPLYGKEVTPNRQTLHELDTPGPARELP